MQHACLGRGSSRRARRCRRIGSVFGDADVEQLLGSTIEAAVGMRAIRPAGFEYAVEKLKRRSAVVSIGPSLRVPRIQGVSVGFAMKTPPVVIFHLCESPDCDPTCDDNLDIDSQWRVA
jgi:hypothetical protein